MRIKLVTINTWKCDGAYETRLVILARQLKEIDPQIIACQECFLTEDGSVDTVLFLAKALDKHHAFLPCRPKKRCFAGTWVQSFSGLAVLSAFPIKEHRGFDLPGEPRDPDRRIQQVRIEIGSGSELELTNVHLTHLPDAFDLRSAQAAFVAEKAIAGFSHDRDEQPRSDGARPITETGPAAVNDKPYVYKLVCGDFNAKPGGGETGVFCKTAQAMDCYNLGQGPEPRRTLLHANAEDACVDHIFTLPLQEPAAQCQRQSQDEKTAELIYPAFRNSSVVLNKPDRQTGLYASDHFGICTTLLL